MNSETWIEPARGRRNAADGARPAVPADSPDALQPWQLFTLAGLIGATVVVFVSRGHTPAGIVLLSLTIFAAAIAGVAAWRTLGPLVMPEDAGTTQILGGRTRAALEREKALVLRSIKELEFDRAMGKVADKDFQEMGARLRARAARLIRQLDAGSNYRDEISKEIDRRIATDGGPDKVRPTGAPQIATGASPIAGHAGRAPMATTSAGRTSMGAAAAGRTSAGAAAAGRTSVGAAAVGRTSVGDAAVGRTLSGPADEDLSLPRVDEAGPADDSETAPPVKCPHCGTENDADSQFCKRCGASLEPTE